MSNYPPGVTGNEPQIAGSEEIEAKRTVGECGMLGLTVIVASRAWGRAKSRKHRRVSARLCTFDGGVVDGFLVGDRFRTTFFWDCPVCLTENEEDGEE